MLNRNTNLDKSFFLPPAGCSPHTRTQEETHQQPRILCKTTTTTATNTCFSKRPFYFKKEFVRRGLSKFALKIFRQIKNSFFSRFRSLFLIYGGSPPDLFKVTSRVYDFRDTSIQKDQRFVCVCVSNAGLQRVGALSILPALLIDLFDMRFDGGHHYYWLCGSLGGSL